jgi:hypothetical protein
LPLEKIPVNPHRFDAARIIRLGAVHQFAARLFSGAMLRRRKKLKKAAGNSAKRPKPRRSKTQFITRAEARRRAERHVLNRMFKGATVRDGAEVRLGIYTRCNWTGKDVWVVYKSAGENGIKSSEVVLVCKRTGRVIYEGSAQDEG